MQARARLPAAFQLPLPGMCASASGLRPSPLPPPQRVSASTQRGRELSAVSQWHLSSSAQTHAPSFPRFISFVLSTAPCRRGGGACGYCPGKQETRVLDSDLAAGSALDSHPLHSSTGAGGHRLAPESVPTAVPGPFAGDTTKSLGPARHAAPSLAARCQPDVLPHPSPRSSHLGATSFAGTETISSAPPVTVTQRSCYRSFDAWCRHGPQPH